ncbi:MAG: hypothetical protein QM762_12800 [Chryseolinea sp.]
MNLSYGSVAALYAKHSYKFYDTGKYNVNIFGIRKDLRVDLFNDIIGVAYIDENGIQQLRAYTATTDPGTYWLKNKLGNVNGTFILRPGNYRHCWRIGQHKGQYEALVQAEPRVFAGWRDGNSDGELDMSGPLYTDVQGLNLHTTSHLKGTAEKVGAYSAACQVIRNVSDFVQLMDIIKKSSALYGNSFSYTLFTAE